MAVFNWEEELFRRNIESFTADENEGWMNVLKRELSIAMLGNTTENAIDIEHEVIEDQPLNDSHKQTE